MSEVDLPRREALRSSFTTLTKLGAFVAISSQLGGAAKAAGRHSNPDYCAPICFLKGTLIETRRGRVAIESLQIGDEVATHRGGFSKIKFVGRMSVAKGPLGWRLRSKPVLFRRSSIAHNVPSRDLFVSQQHAMLVDGVFIPAKYLVNGSTISIVTPASNSVDYFQIECETHEAIFANGAPAESFFATNDRERFANYPEYAALYGSAPVKSMSPYRPIHRFQTLAQKAGAAAGLVASWFGIVSRDPVLQARAKLRLRAQRLASVDEGAPRRVLVAAAAARVRHS